MCFHNITVSILVFVELALDGYTFACAFFIEFRFNPCFRGTCSWWVRFLLVQMPLTYCFNPCFRGTCSWCRSLTFSPGISQRFQSLFSWNLLLMVCVLRRPGLAIRFQSLFSWNLLLMCGDHHSGRIFQPSFNPCFRGTCSWCIFPLASIRAWNAFQSLFSWNLLLMFRPLWPYFPARPVSILVFVELALDVSASLAIFSSQTGFNPCFRGTCSWCWLRSRPLLPPCCQVSILVFVELALDVYLQLYAYLLLHCFNPCFRGTCSWCWIYGTNFKKT